VGRSTVPDQADNLAVLDDAAMVQPLKGTFPSRPASWPIAGYNAVTALIRTSRLDLIAFE
jgi:hypothetical protein